MVIPIGEEHTSTPRKPDSAQPEADREERGEEEGT